MIGESFSKSKKKATSNIRIHLDYHLLNSDYDACFTTSNLVKIGNPLTFLMCNKTNKIIDNCYYKCEKDDLISSEFINNMHTLVSESSDILSGLITLNDPLPKTLLSNQSCGDIQIPSYLVNEGVNADLVIFITGRPILSDDVLAYASSCQIDLDTGRPIAGVLNVNPASFDDFSERVKVTIVAHEMTHILGFTWDHLSSIPNATEASTVRGGTPVMYLKTPNVVNYLKNFFSCDTLIGAELENQGGPGTQYSHWEKRIFQSEYMTGTISVNAIVSDLTLNLLDDFGYYQTIKSNHSGSIQRYNPFAMNSGCQIVNEKCSTWPKDNVISICDTVKKVGCSYEGRSKANCQYFQYYNQSIPSYFQYFRNPQDGGSVLPDYCPTIEGSFNGDCREISNKDEYSENRLEYFGDDSRCFLSTITDIPPTVFINDLSPSCYQSVCISNNTIMIKIKKYYYPCQVEGKKLDSVDDANGVLSCPNVTYYCDKNKVDESWPLFESVTPNEGRENTRFLILGTNFVEGMKVVISGIECQVLSLTPQQIEAQLGKTGFMFNDLIANVFVIDPTTGKNAAGVSSFKLLKSKVVGGTIGFLKDLFNTLFVDYWYVTFLVVCAIIFLISLIIYLRRRHQRSKYEPLY